MKTTVNIFRTLLLAVLTLTFGACGEDSLLSELGLDGQTATKADGAGEVWDGTVAAAFAGGSGTVENPYQIANGAQLARFAAIVNGTLDGTQQNKAACGKLTADILLNDISNWTSWNETTAPTNSWTPIGSRTNQFTGTLDGDGHSVSGIYISNSYDHQGLVGFLYDGGKIQNLGVEASYINSSGSNVGGLCGMNQGTVTNCYNTGNVTGSSLETGSSSNVGGLCGYNNEGTVTNCYNTGKVTSRYFGFGSNNVGGVCGKNWGSVTNCYYLTGKANSGIGEGSGDATEKSADEFASGEVAWLLSTGENGEIWGQNLTLDPKDDYPVLGGLKVVQSGEGSYTNELSQDGGFYLISTADELRLFASMVNGGQTSINAKLTADIELNNTTNWKNWETTAPANSWTPIGDRSYHFTGTFDGQGHTISGLYVNGSDYSIYNVGLFGCLEDGGTVENVGVTKSYMQSSDYTGGIVGLMYGGTIRNCYCTGIVRCQGYGGGGIVGMSYGYDNSTIENCYFAGRISSEYGSAEMIGPIVGGMHAEYVNSTNCYYLEGCGASGKGTSMTEAQFKSGEVASLLGEGWGQTIGTDDYPVPTSDASKKVYVYTMYQGQSTETGYANNNGSIDLDLASHPNTIAVFEASGTFAGKNIVVKDGDSYTCANLVLTDDADFYTPVVFTATNATYTRTPKVWANGESGWETICLPFSGTLYAGDVAKQPILTDLEGDYWLRSLTDFKTPNTLIFASGSIATAANNQIEAGVPYIIALPGEKFGSESLQGKTISVRGTNVKVINTAQSVAAGSMFAFTGTFATKACDALSYKLNSENGTGGAGDLFVLDTELTDLAPFRCRIDVTGLNIGGASTRSASGLPKELRIGQ